MDYVFTIIFIILIIIFILIAIYLYFQNNAIQITNIDIKDSNIPDGFQNFKILHISDLHNKQFGENQKNIINKIKEISPDIIVITGDTIDSYSTNVDISTQFINGISSISPVYYVPGNHESRLPDEYAILKKQMGLAGVNILENKYVTISKGEDKINIVGIVDPAFYKTNAFENNDKEIVENVLNDVASPLNRYTILLSHRPELIESYSKFKINLVFAGHAHGGQIRLPFIGGVIAPNQGFLPKFTSGLYEFDKTKMVVSRGLGNSAFPFRVNNRPEIIVANLNKF